MKCWNFVLNKVCKIHKRHLSKNLPTVHELKRKRFKLLGIDEGYNPVPTDRRPLLKYLPKPEDLPARNIKDSFLEAILPLSTDNELQDKYITFLGRVRLGRLLEEMDIFAVHVGYKHIHAPTVPENVPSPFILVTAHCDQIDFTTFVRKHNEDIKLSGFVSWVGRSSLEVVVWLEQHFQGSWHKITRAFFILAARNPTGSQAAEVNKIQPLNSLEETIFREAEIRKTNRTRNSIDHISKVIPTSEEQKLVHDLYLSVLNYESEHHLIKKEHPEGTIPMDKCDITNIIFCQPENRNYYNTVFGGFIMRHATELAWVLGYQFIRQRPLIENISDIVFHKSVAVNALIHMRARVTYTQGSRFQIFVTVTALDPLQGKATKSNTFHFTMGSTKPVRQVYPKLYHEAMLYVDGRRHFNAVVGNSKGSNKDVLDEYMCKIRSSK